MAAAVLALAFLTLFMTRATAGEPCKVSLIGELPVTMEGMRPLVHAAVNGKDLPFIADSGAFFSMLTPEDAEKLGLRLSRLIWLTGTGGATRAGVTTAKTFTIFNVEVHDVDFVVLANDLHTSAAGVLGQNVLRLGDAEYDLANSVIRFLRTHGDCTKSSLAYWANSSGLPYSEIEIEAATAQTPHTTGAAYVDGRKLRVLFDTGASASIMTLDAARHAGVTPDSPGVRPGGPVAGIGPQVTRSWIAPFASFKIGDEEIRNTHLRIGTVGLADVDMLIAADFFLAHRIYVANSQHKLYFTYSGGPVFNLTNMPEPGSETAKSGPPGGTEPPVSTPTQTAMEPTADEPLDAAGYARRGSLHATRHDYQRAIADFTRAIELAPAEPDYYYQRATAHSQNKELDEALEDLTQAVKRKPDDVRALMARAALRALRHDGSDMIGPDLDAVDRAVTKDAAQRLALGTLYAQIGNYTAAIAQYDHWLEWHDSLNAEYPLARNDRCRARALADRDLLGALADCDVALERVPKSAEFLDTRGLLYLRRGNYKKAIADYNAALALNPKLAWSLYGRELAKRHRGQTAEGQADIDAATALSPKIAEEAASHGIVL